MINSASTSKPLFVIQSQKAKTDDNSIEYNNAEPQKFENYIKSGDLKK